MTSRAFCFAMIKGWSWKAILGGVAIEFIGPQIFNLLIVLPVILVLYSLDSLDGKTLSELWVSAPSSIHKLVGGSAIVSEVILNAVGGYAAATWALKYKIGHALLVGMVSLALGVLMHGSESAWYLFNPLWIIPASLLGGWWSIKTRCSKKGFKPKTNSSDGSPPIGSPF